jgi:cob(I)alamin adenosyltransferase
MGHRLSAIVTRTGDDGTTGLADNTRVSKNAPLIHVMGDVDELNSQIGVLLCHVSIAVLHEQLTAIQHDLFDMGGQLAMPAYKAMTAEKITRLDGWLSTWNSQLPPLKEFILPRGSLAVVHSHVCRTVCRRVERTLVTLGLDAEAQVFMQQYINRLSDYLFVIGRVLAQHDGAQELMWAQQTHGG